MKHHLTLGIFGFGYSAASFAKLLNNQAYHILATSRQPEAGIKLASNIELLQYNHDTAKKILDVCDAVLVTIPPDKEGNDPVLKAFESLFKKAGSNLRWLAYLSSTGVYGDHQGQWVDETSVFLNPGEAGKKRIHAEQAWLSLYQNHHLPVHLFRLAGIYGPGRSSIDKIKSGKQFSYYKKGLVFSRIHVEDIASALQLSLNHPTPGEIYNVCDDYPAATHEVDAFAAQLLGQAPPKLIPYEQGNLSPMGLEFFSASKRVSNQKIKQNLGFQLHYPSYREGLTAIFKTFG